jgi:hypothetical protein
MLNCPALTILGKAEFAWPGSDAASPVEVGQCGGKPHHHNRPYGTREEVLRTSILSH